jgi:hypothetical protein
LGHAAEEPPPRKESVRARRRMTTMVEIVVGGLGLHVDVYRVQTELRAQASAGQLTTPRCATAEFELA